MCLSMGYDGTGNNMICESFPGDANTIMNYFFARLLVRCILFLYV